MLWQHFMTHINQIFEYTTDAVFGTDKHKCIRYWNKNCEELFGKSSKDVLGSYCFDIICGEDLLGNKYCSKKCLIANFHNKYSPNNNIDMVIKSRNGESVLVNIGSYYTNLSEKTDDDINVFHSIRVISSCQFLRRLMTNSEKTENQKNNINRLSKREYEILKMVTSGKKTNNVASQLGISNATVRNHVKNIYAKLEVHSLVEAINYAMRHGMNMY